jgi:hypothetical protein
MNPDRAFPRSHDLPACNCPCLPGHLSPSLLPSSVSYSVRRMPNRISDDPICNLSQPRRQISALLILDQPISAQIKGRLLPEPSCAGKLTRKPSTRNSTAAQPGRSQPHHREAFLRLAMSQRIEALPRLTDTVVITDEALL